MLWQTTKRRIFASKIIKRTHIYINFSDEKEQESVFNNLAAGGNVTMPLADAFWGAKFGMLVDKFGINWMVNYDYNQSK